MTAPQPPQMMAMPRRSFIQGILAAGALTAVSPRGSRAAASQKVRLACVGIGNQAGIDLQLFNATGLAEIVALCDTEMGAAHTRKSLETCPKATRFTDFRRMFDQMAGQIDAVLVGTPDFSHFPIAMLAMSLGKAVYVEKPLAHSFRQIERMMAAEKKYRVPCQMGNQGHSEANYFQFKAWVEAGILKNVTKIDAFMHHPRRWHGMKVEDFLPAQQIPETLDWDCWLNTAQAHPYNRGYLNGEWRSWYTLGNGALGDWGAHILDTAHEFLNLGLPTEIEAVKLEGHSPLIFPQASTLAFRFPKRGSQPAVEVNWYDGVNNFAPLPADVGVLGVDPNIPPPGGKAGSSKRPPGKIIYSDDLVFKGGTHGSILEILGERAKDMASKLPNVPRSPSNHYANFLKACQGEETCRSNFGVAGPLCQTMALGIIAQRVNAKLTFDPQSRQITNHKVANELLAGAPPRKGWEEFYRL